MRLIDLPIPVKKEAYARDLQRMQDRLQGHPGVLAIYQIGHVNNPGISDIDLMVVFNPGKRVELNPMQDLSPAERYVFTHSLFGISARDFEVLPSFTLFHNYRLIWGQDLYGGGSTRSSAETEALRVQTAFEFLVKNYIDIVLQYTYGIVKLRVLFQHVKGLRYDLDFLGVQDRAINDLVNTLVSWIPGWFDGEMPIASLQAWLAAFVRELEEFLAKALQARSFYVPSPAPGRFARNIRTVASNNLGYTHEGVVLPSLFARLGRRYFNLQHRLNKFTFNIPMQVPVDGTFWARRFEFFRDMKQDVHKHYIHFAPPIPVFTSNVL